MWNLATIKKVKMVCSRCGSEDVMADAYTEWNVETQTWEIAQAFEQGAHCSKCDRELELSNDRCELLSPNPNSERIGIKTARAAVRARGRRSKIT
jgi:hypothetical protein